MEHFTLFGRIKSNLGQRLHFTCAPIPRWPSNISIVLKSELTRENIYIYIYSLWSWLMSVTSQVNPVDTLFYVYTSRTSVVRTHRYTRYTNISSTDLRLLLGHPVSRRDCKYIVLSVVRNLKFHELGLYFGS